MKEIEVEGYERVVYVTDESVGLKAIIAIHSTQLGPALGGIRIYPYASDEDALNDALRLARGMSYKAAISGLGLGGGKSVIILDPRSERKTPQLLRSFARAVDALAGTYICAEDSGCTTDDVRIIREITPYVVGLDDVNSSGDPSPFTAWGTLRGIQAALMHTRKSQSLQGVVVALQGVGAVGAHLAEILYWHGAELIVSDVDEARAVKIARRFGARVVLPSELITVPCDILAPCALGGVITRENVPLLRCKIIAGCANNQLLTPDVADLLRLHKIHYVPDFVLNAGGLKNVDLELSPQGYSPVAARERIDDIYAQVLSLFELSEKNNITTDAAARKLAEHRIAYGVGKRTQQAVFHEVGV